MPLGLTVLIPVLGISPTHICRHTGRGRANPCTLPNPYLRALLTSRWVTAHQAVLPATGWLVLM